MTTTILVVDAIEADRAMLRRALKGEGYDVIAAANGAEAVALTQEWRPDIMVTDLSMPIMDGIEAWRLIDELTDEPPIGIVLTGAMIRDVRLICDDIGFRAFLTKPVDLQILLATIRKLAPAQPERLRA